MTTLNNLQKIKKLDSGRVLDSIEALGAQISQAWQEVGDLKLPATFKNFDKIVLNGMGGSALGADVIRSLFADRLKAPLIVINSYQPPKFLDGKTLYIASSYSGTTEEVIYSLAQAKKKQAKIFVIANGGRLGELVGRKSVSGYVFNPRFNPSGQPRMGLGYSLGAQLGLLKKVGLLDIAEQEIKDSLTGLAKLHRKFGASNPEKNNPAKKLAVFLRNKTALAVAAEFLSGNAHVFANQINENAKNFADYFLISELNHHLLEGLSFPRSNAGHLAFVFFDSRLYFPLNQKRLRITRDVAAKNKIKSFYYRLSGPDKLSQVLEMLVFGSYASFYLAVLNNVNPSKIPWVDYFKAKLKA